MAKQDKKKKKEQKGADAKAGNDRGGNGRRYALYGAAGVGLVAAAGFAYLVYRERTVEKPDYKLVEQDGQFEVRDYPEILVAEATNAGERQFALDQGFGQLADYIFAKSRDGKKLPMTAPVLNASAGPQDWVTRFVMPAGFTRETLPAATGGIRINTIPARRVAAVRFAGTSDEAVLADYEQQLRDWVGAKKFAVRGEPERAFYNSPYIPPPMRRTEVLIPIG